MNNEKFNVKLQNPPLIVMLCLLISLVFLFKSLDLLSQIYFIINIEDKPKLTSSIKEIIKGKDVRITLK